ncbi:hypothetical protein AGR5A_Cc10064 [Agrobacterium genomosp. 5 str. CFBP 6626]|nr:hypothetical protein AGR5A_Cc10064 [Agrobacterium genomosp. 5 str. CFBP 6626]
MRLKPAFDWLRYLCEGETDLSYAHSAPTNTTSSSGLTGGSIPVKCLETFVDPRVKLEDDG